MGLAAMCPGTFDPVTNGHTDIIRRVAGVFDQVVVAVLENSGKEPLFSMEERTSMLKEALGDVDGLEVASFSGLLVDFAKQRGITVIVKGLRAVTDFDYELQMAQMNHQMTGIETFFVPTSPQWSFLSSSLIKEIVRHGGDVSGMVPENVHQRMRDKLVGGD